ncbi:MAG: CPBP family intramembrane glutamic endopeptidase [Steroidobacteraceae bacterium]
MIAAPEPLDESPRLRLKPVPLLVTVALALGVPMAGVLMTSWASRLLHLHAPFGMNLSFIYLQHTGQLIVALLVIAILKYRFVPADYGLHWPRGKTYVWPAILWGVFFGVLMTGVDYAPQLLTHARINSTGPPSPASFWGWTFFEGVYVGPTEEIPFRALLVTYLIATMPGKLRIGRFEMSWAGIIVAAMFALLHANNFATRAWPLALGQQFYAFALGVLYAYWLEKSRSVLAASIGHNVGDVVEYLLAFAWLGVWPS